ncbi:hypothetical protein ACH5RR_028775 [Cinchona calisaya]|uniref:R13L1/DRL21-like LRR repeat region domain-containing protein n=1 Tax=Cinchona calisaya TaxID=153742 RepID=A0ABD2YRJ7_9GENT
MGKLENRQVLTCFVVGKDGDSGIQELGKFQKLNGKRLFISRLENVSCGRDASMANMKGMKHLQHLTLNWNGDAEGSQEKRGSVVLCTKIAPEARQAILGSLKEIAQKAKEKRGDFEEENPFGRFMNEYDGDEVQEIPHLQAKGVLFNEIETLVGKGKRKATTVNSPFYQNAIDNIAAIGHGENHGSSIRLLRICVTDEKPSMRYVYEGEIAMFRDRDKSFGRKLALTTSRTDRLAQVAAGTDAIPPPISSTSSHTELPRDRVLSRRRFAIPPRIPWYLHLQKAHEQHKNVGFAET